MVRIGTFIINGTERVVVSQLVRSPGVYFDADIDKKTERDIYLCKVIPTRGSWIELETDKKNLVYTKGIITDKQDSEKKISIPDLMRKMNAVRVSAMFST